MTHRYHKPGIAVHENTDVMDRIVIDVPSSIRKGPNYPDRFFLRAGLAAGQGLRDVDLPAAAGKDYFKITGEGEFSDRLRYQPFCRRCLMW